MKYEVQTLFTYGYENCWTVDGEPQTFDTVEEAEAEIAELIADCEEAVRRGDMEDAPPRDDFRVVPVGTESPQSIINLILESEL